MTDAAPLPLAQVEHRLPGRLRLRVVSRRDDAAWFERAAAGLAADPAVRAVRANPGTASLLVEHDGDEPTVLAAASARGLFDASPRPTPVARPTPAAPPSPATALPGLEMAAAGFVAAGALQLVRGRVVGSATENLWNAYLVFAGTRQAGPTALLVALGLLQIARGEILGSASSLFLYAWRAHQIARHRPAGIV